MRLAILILCVSAAVLGYEIALMRALSVARWHHFAHMIVSVALLGFGASGTLISLLRERLLRRFDGNLTAFAAAFALAIPLSFLLAQRVPFDAFQLAWDWRQYLYLFAYYLVLFVPFVLGATCIGLALVREAERVHRLYFWNLLGSGLGSCGIVAAMLVLRPEQLPLVLFALAAVGTIVYGLPVPGRRPSTLAPRVYVAFGVVLAFLLWRPPALNVSEHKQLRLLLDLPDTKVVERQTGPLGLIHVIDGPAIRLVPGRSVAYTGPEPRQRAILVDADSPSAINHVTDARQLEGFDFTTGALPYHLLDRPKTLIVGAGGGSDVLLARYHGCPSITALEHNPQVVAMMTGSQAEFAQHVYEQPGVRLVAADARGFLAQTNETFDLIQLPLVESLGAASAGVAALNESYLYTAEALQAYLDHIDKNRGILCITRWMKTPPSDAVRVLATVIEALERRGLEHSNEYLVAIRGMFTVTILARRRPFSSEELEAVRAFCRERSFDVVWVDEMWLRPRSGRFPVEGPLEDVNERNELPEAYYADATMKLISGERDAFIRSYPLDISPTTDDRPYHSLTFRWRAFRHLRETMGDQWVRYADWGYLVLVATLVQAIVAGLAIVLVPLLFVRRQGGPRGGRLATCVYFACLGVAYMCIEIVMMQKLSLFLASPIYSAAVVLTSFMVFSGLGSLTAGRLLDGERRSAGLGLACIVLIGLVQWVWLDPALRALAGTSAWVRFPVAGLASGVLAFFMGMPFPSGLRRVASQFPALTPWAWGVNGCASVIGATLAMTLAVSFGFRAVLLLAFALYALAALALRGVRRQTGGNLS